ncbi:potassium channel family protein [Enhygromyxa salina]|uniref:Ion channel n=1 Tax=Enhygromyxa salina TaxID=215803 RepID=A0A2S9YXI0_9BACT|nr:potassium channel family protein [Enhygromyxa salina]PRQ09806.1 Ion channel [Enhygromyxa salina]
MTRVAPHERSREGRFIALFVLTLALHVALPIFRDVGWLNLIAGAGFIAVVGVAGWLTIDRAPLRVAYLALMLVSVLSTAGLIASDDSLSWRGAWLVFHAALIGLTAILVIRWTIRAQRVTVDTIFAALSGYYLLGFTWALIYAIADIALPGSFNVELVDGARLDRAFYFSFVTLTTLGFGDTTPTHPLTQALVATQALIGQIYLVVLVARLVATQANAGRESGACGG